MKFGNGGDSLEKETAILLAAFSIHKVTIAIKDIFLLIFLSIYKPQ